MKLTLVTQSGLVLALIPGAIGATVSRHEPNSQHVLQGPLDLGSTSLTDAESSLTRSSAGFVAFGDSYSAGIGTGGTLDKGKENACNQGRGAWPLMIHRDLNASQGDAVSTSFQWLACTGSTTEELLSGGKSSQIDSLNVSEAVDFATLSVGGNDVGFFAVINSCIFRFYSFYSGTCEQALLEADAHIRSSDFEHRLDIVLNEILDKVHWDRKPWFMITVIGYAQFFNADTSECDDYSLGVWWGGPKLSRDIRKRMNLLVLALNEKLKRTIATVNSRFARTKVYFVDIDATFQTHRFCEPGVVEPDYGRLDTWFFLVSGPDNARNTTQWPNATSSGLQSRSPRAMLPHDREKIEPHVCISSAEASGDWGQMAACYMATAKHIDHTLRLNLDSRAHVEDNWWVPTYYGQVFHPRSLGHEAIKDRIYEVWAENGV